MLVNQKTCMNFLPRSWRIAKLYGLTLQTIRFHPRCVDFVFLCIFLCLYVWYFLYVWYIWCIIFPAWQDYKESEDPSKFKSEKTGRGPLVGKWQQTSNPVMTCYKLVTVEFKWFGLQTKVESMIQKVRSFTCKKIADHVSRRLRGGFSSTSIDKSSAGWIDGMG